MNTLDGTLKSILKSNELNVFFHKLTNDNWDTHLHNIKVNWLQFAKINDLGLLICTYYTLCFRKMSSSMQCCLVKKIHKHKCYAILGFLTSFMFSSPIGNPYIQKTITFIVFIILWQNDQPVASSKVNILPKCPIFHHACLGH